MNPKILISTSSFGTQDPAPLTLLKRVGLDVVLNPHGRTLKSDELLALAASCVGIIAGTERYDAATLTKLSTLKVLSRCGVGMDGIDFEAAQKAQIQIHSTPQGPTQAVAELTLGLILSLIRQVHAMNLGVHQGKWDKQMGLQLSEITVGILGLGRIGRQLASLVRLLGGTVIGFDVQPDTAWAQKHQVTLQSQDEVVRGADVLCLHMPYSATLHHAINEKILRAMKPGSFLINTSRGGLVDEAALHKALQDNHLAGAALDVFEQEPYNGPLKDVPQVILTPHIGSYARACRIAMETEAAQNLIQGLHKAGILSRT